MSVILKIPRKFVDLITRHFGHQYERLLEKEIVGICETLLDIGCGPSSPIQRFSSRLRYSVGIDFFEPYLCRSQKANIHNEYRLLNALEIKNHFDAKSFDCVLAADMVEHLSKGDGLKLISIMERLARKKVIVFTPNGFLRQFEPDSDPYSTHLSGWEVGEFENLDFKVIGVNGWRLLRKERGFIRWRPVLMWDVISLLSEIPTAKHPKHAFQLFCVKHL
jgi:hypothetical protein